MLIKSDQLWGGRFTETPNETFAEFNDSFRFDRRLFAADVRASIAHARALHRAGMLDADETTAIENALNELLIESFGALNIFDGSNAEDVHSFIESKLVEKIGDAGRRIHTGRSRNDQVATAFRVWMRGEIDTIDDLAKALQIALVQLARTNESIVMPGYTHLQRAQPILFAHWCLAYFEMLRRDRERLIDVRGRVNVMPLGSGALAGTGVDIDRDAVAADLQFAGISRNSLDAVSDRDFAIEFAAGCSLVMIHLSRLAEDLIIYNSTEFGFITLSDSVASGSSLMPQKKNPDALELLRGKSGRVIGHLVSLLTMMKGLPLAYNKDMQEDKEAVFDTADTVSISLRAAALVLDNVTVNAKRCREAATHGYLNATELADYLVRKGVPFRTAHEAVGRIVLHAIEQGKELDELSLGDLRKFAPEIDEDVFEALTVEAALNAKSTIGGTSSARVVEALREAETYLEIA